MESGSRRAVMPITVISGSQLNADSLRQPWVMARLGFLRGRTAQGCRPVPACQQCFPVATSAHGRTGQADCRDQAGDEANEARAERSGAQGGCREKHGFPHPERGAFAKCQNSFRAGSRCIASGCGGL